MPKTEHKSYKCITSDFGENKIYIFTMKVKDAIKIHYVAVRGRDEEEGAVQRVLNPRRISSIAEFVLAGNMFVNTFVLNWTHEEEIPKITKGKITMPILGESAQVIDGQHRLAGLKQALGSDKAIGEKEIYIALAIGLVTEEAAKIFLNINTEQKPVPKSLVYDLYGIVDGNKDLAINRATDIARDLNSDEESPYYERIKFPGKDSMGRIDLSTVVSSLKKHLEVDGAFATHNLRSFNSQKTVISNFFISLASIYSRDDLWNKAQQNPFMKNTGFFAAIEYIVGNLIPKCADKRSFTQETMKTIMGLQGEPLLKWEDISGKDGKTARKVIRNFLNSHSTQTLPSEKEYDF